MLTLKYVSIYGGVSYRTIVTKSNALYHKNNMYQSEICLIRIEPSLH